jgi:hypothetical protein
MPKIESVWFIDANTLETWLDNGQRIWLAVSAITRDSRLSAFIAEEPDIFYKPETDGQRVHWRGGPSLSLPDILEIAKHSGNLDAREALLPKIVHFGLDDEYPNELLVELDNGNSLYLYLDLTNKPQEPLFAGSKAQSPAAKENHFCGPAMNPEPLKTDGYRVYWSNGASLTVGELFDIVVSE